MENENKILTFTDLKVWQVSRKLVFCVYSFTKNFPKEERFSLASQMRRSSISIISNIAEGFSRIHYKEKIYFYSIALGSLTELQSQIIIARDLDYLDKDLYQNVIEKTVSVHKMLNGLIKSIKKLL